MNDKPILKGKGIGFSIKEDPKVQERKQMRIESRITNEDILDYLDEINKKLDKLLK